MVKLDNWQAKAEKAGERRIVGKQRKQQRDKTRSNKALSQKLLALIDQHNDRLISHADDSSSPLEIHAWTDSAPTGYGVEAVDERDPKTPEKKKGRPRSNSEIFLTRTPQSGGFGGKK